MKDRETWDDRYDLMNKPYLHYGVVTATANFLAGVESPACVILVNGLVTVTLPAAVENKGKAFWIKNIGVFAVTIAPTGGDSIEGAPVNQSLPDQFDVMHLVSDGTGWWILSFTDL